MPYDRATDLQLLKTLNKYYLVDLGLRTLLMGQDREDTGHMLENLVYFELLRRGWRVTIGKVERWDAAARKTKSVEVDFVARKGRAVSYYQVSESIMTRPRASASLPPCALYATIIPSLSSRVTIQPRTMAAFAT